MNEQKRANCLHCFCWLILLLLCGCIKFGETSFCFCNSVFAVLVLFYLVYAKRKTIYPTLNAIAQFKFKCVFFWYFNWLTEIYPPNKVYLYRKCFLKMIWKILFTLAPSLAHHITYSQSIRIRIRCWYALTLTLTHTSSLFYVSVSALF